MRTDFERYVGGQKMGKANLVFGHIWLEHVLIRSLFAVLPNPEALFRNRSPSFSQLVALCEAHGVVDGPLAASLRRVNSIRNKCAHRATYEPTDDELSRILDPLLEKNSDLEPQDPWDSLVVVSSLLEDRARNLGASDLQAILPPRDPLVDAILDGD